MNKKDIEKFDKLLQGKSGAGFNTFDEIGDIIVDLIKIKVDANQSRLLEKITQNIEFNSVDEVNDFLGKYFNFHNSLIMEFDRFDTIEDDNLFDKEMKKFTINIFHIVKKEKLQEVLLSFIFKLVTTVMDQYVIEISQDSDSDEYLNHLIEVFGDEDIAFLYIGVNVIATHISEKKNIKYDELIEMSASVLIFCMAMNSLRKVNFENIQNQQESFDDSANSVAYNVGRNDPCPCGSGRKYKKCCLNKNRPTVSQKIDFEEPQDILPALSKKELHELYAIWSRFLNFVSKAYAGAVQEKYMKIYDKNPEGEYFLTDDAIGEKRHYLTIRNFLNEYFFMLLDHFIDDNRVSQKNIDILCEIRDTYKCKKFISYEMFANGNAIVYNIEDENCFYAHKSFYDYSKVFPKNEIYDTMFFSYKGRIISDGVATKDNIQIGSNMQDMMMQDYKNKRKNLQFQLEINEPPKQDVYQLKISIKGAKPPIWRRILVKPNTTFYGLHDIIQSIFNWEDYHMFMFFGSEKNYTDYEMISEDVFGGNKEFPASDYTIDSELKKIKDKINYVYDFGDNWQHEILLEKIVPLDRTLSYPLCTGGKRRGPIEDSGGIWNYNDIADAIENPSFDNQHILGEDGERYYENIDPKEFDKNLVNSILQNEY